MSDAEQIFEEVLQAWVTLSKGLVVEYSVNDRDERIQILTIDLKAKHWRERFKRAIEPSSRGS